MAKLSMYEPYREQIISLFNDNLAYSDILKEVSKVFSTVKYSSLRRYIVSLQNAKVLGFRERSYIGEIDYAAFEELIIDLYKDEIPISEIMDVLNQELPYTSLSTLADFIDSLKQKGIL